VVAFETLKSSFGGKISSVANDGADKERLIGLSEGAEKVPRAIKSVPQRLKPRCE
jgi:hypothetical protein